MVEDLIYSHANQWMQDNADGVVRIIYYTGPFGSYIATGYAGMDDAGNLVAFVSLDQLQRNNEKTSPTTSNIEGPKEPQQINTVMHSTPLFNMAQNQPDIDPNFDFIPFPLYKGEIKRGAQPKGTTHDIPTYAGKELIKLRYKVTHVSGLETNMPAGEPIVYLAYAGGPVGHGVVTQHTSMPLRVFAKDAVPVSKNDIFWE